MFERLKLAFWICVWGCVIIFVLGLVSHYPIAIPAVIALIYFLMKRAKKKKTLSWKNKENRRR